MTNAAHRVCRKLVVLLMKPTKYDEDGYLVQFEKGVLPCNSLAVMYNITKEAFKSERFRGVDCRVVALDETVRAGRVDVKRLMAEHRSPTTTVIVGLVAVQTNQFPRACDLAERFQDEGATVIMGGFHVSGSIAMLYDGGNPKVPCPKVMPPECQALMDRGVVIFHGEAEELWGEVLTDILGGRVKLLYRGGNPSIVDAPLPEYPPRYFDGFFGSFYTVDTGRGCPFHCSFCSIINVQGNTPRYRDVGAIVGKVRQLAQAEKKPFIFFTDDNFARNPHWEDILLGLIALRDEGLAFHFMIEADLAAWRLKGKKSGTGFVELLSRAGCSQVFQGVESVRQKALLATGKPQNRVADYRTTCDLYHRYGIACHAGYIIGFPDDTPETIREDIPALHESGFDQASFFMLTPIPGSEDHARKFVAGDPMDADFNRYDSFGAVMDHPQMSREAWKASYEEAWQIFYAPSHMAAALKRIAPEHYWGLFRDYLWYRWSAFTERTHPMIAGLYRYRRYGDRRPSTPRISRLEHWSSEVWRHIRYLGCLLREFYVFQGVYFETKWLTSILEKTEALGDARATLTRRFELIEAYEREWRRCLRESRWFTKTFGIAAHRGWLNDFWRRYGRERWNLLMPWKWGWHLRMLPHAMTEVVYTFRFGWPIVHTFILRT